jgi:hypothetical protein
MSEERMIRVTKPESIDGEVGIRVFFDYYKPDGVIGRYGMVINNFDDLELAPPKDWKPYCHNQNCDTGVFSLDDECYSCPYRKRD